jgi:hypothetical protein
MLKAYFVDWYSSPDTLDPAAKAIATSPSLWKSLLSYDPSLPQPQLLDPNSNIPPALQDGLRRACACKVSTNTMEKLDNLIRAPVTHEDFAKAIQAITTGGAPGLSDHSANMVKAWSESTTKIVFEHMTNIWESQFSPSWFKDKVVKLSLSTENPRQH